MNMNFDKPKDTKRPPRAFMKWVKMMGKIAGLLVLATGVAYGVYKAVMYYNPPKHYGVYDTISRMKADGVDSLDVTVDGVRYTVFPHVNPEFLIVKCGKYSSGIKIEEEAGGFRIFLKDGSDTSYVPAGESYLSDQKEIYENLLPQIRKAVRDALVAIEKPQEQQEPVKKPSSCGTKEFLAMLQESGIDTIYINKNGAMYSVMISTDTYDDGKMACIRMAQLVNGQERTVMSQNTRENYVLYRQMNVYFNGQKLDMHEVISNEDYYLNLTKEIRLIARDSLSAIAERRILQNKKQLPTDTLKADTTLQAPKQDTLKINTTKKGAGKQGVDTTHKRIGSAFSHRDFEKFAFGRQRENSKPCARQYMRQKSA